MNDEIYWFLSNYFSKKYNIVVINKEDILEYLEEEKEVYTEPISNFRWWNTHLVVVQIDYEGKERRWFGFEVARTTGDNSPEDLGYTPNYDIKEYAPKIVTKTRYMPKGQGE